MVLSVKEYNDWGEIPWKNTYSKRNSVITRGKKARYSIDIIAALALLGPGTTREMAKFILSKMPEYVYEPVRDIESSVLENNFRRRIIIKEKKTTGGKKLGKKYPGLIEEGYVVETDTVINSKGIPSKTYFLSLKGCFFALGFNFDKDETLLFLEHASKNHMYFAYINKITKITSYAFVNAIFIRPIRDMIEKERLFLDDLEFHFSNIEDAHRKACKGFVERYLKYHNPENLFLDKLGKNIQSMINCTYYDSRFTEDLQNFMTEYLYKSKKEQKFFKNYDNGSLEFILLNQIMKSIHFGYYEAMGLGIPMATQKIPTSKEWKKHMKFDTSVKTPRRHGHR